MSTKEITLHASAAETATGGVAFRNDTGAKGIHLVLDVTAVSGTTPTLDVKLQRFDAASGKYVDLASAAFAQKTATGTSDLTIYPGIAETANVSVSDVLSENLKIVWTLGGTTPSFTFTLGATLLG